MTEHTPTPWELDDDGPTVYLYTKISSTIWLRGSVACLTDFGWGAPHLANAEFILKAVNSHEALVKALESLALDPPATLDEPDTDCEVITKMRAIARDALDAVGIAGDTP